MFDECVIRGRRFAPARFCAPLANYTHSAFRRLLAELGGCGAVWTEMLAGKQLLGESFSESPWLKRRPEEKNLVYQLMVRDGDPMDRILGRFEEHGVDAVDLNLACDAKTVRATEAGSALFEDFDALCRVVSAARQHWPGILTAKIRLGSRRPDWQPRFVERLRFLEEAGVDAVTLHPRFFEDKFRRLAQHNLLAWVASLSRLPIIANGDFTSREQVEAQAERLRPACGIMIGRMAIARPWIFAHWDQLEPVDFAGIWRKMAQYIMEDFPPARAARRLKLFARYYAANFAFGHRFYVEVYNAPTLEAVLAVADEFFSRNPATLDHPVVAGL